MSECQKKIREAKFHVDFIKSRIDKVIELVGESKFVVQELKKIKELL